MKLLLIVLCVSADIVFGQDIPTLVPVDPFNPTDDADRLNRALDGLGTNEDKITEVLCYRTASQRDTITTTYNGLHGNLAQDLEAELLGSFQTLTIMLTHYMVKFLTIEVNEVINRRGTDETSLTEIMMSRSNQEMIEMSSFYNLYYGHTLIADLEADTSGAYKKLVVQMSEGRRDESNLVDPNLVAKDVTDLYEGGPAINGTVENVYVDIFSLRSFAHLDAVATLYKETYGIDLSTVVSLEFKDDMGNALVSILNYSHDKAIYFSNRYYNTFAGLGAEDRDLMRLTVSRCEIDLGNIKMGYQALYGVALSDDIRGNTSGSFTSALLALIG